MYTLGINAAFHDSSACLVRDGQVIAAAEEERFTRIKHAKRPVPFAAWELPFHAIDYCLAEADLELTDVAHVAYALDPSLLPDTGRSAATIALPLEPSAQPPARADDPGASPWEPLFLAYVMNAPRQLAGGAPHHLTRRFRGARPDGPYRWHFVEHHAAHEASAYLAAPFERMAVMTLDGRGERATTTFGLYRDGKYRRLKQVDYPHSLGLLYEDVTRHLGFLHSSDEYKVMALASYGEPRCLEAFRSLLRLDGEGGYRERGERGWTMEHAYYGPGYSDRDIEALLRWSGAPYRRAQNISDETAELLARGRIVGWFQGRMEFGPRALGARSILASPIDAGMQQRLNALKDREDFRPVVLEEALGDWFTPAHANGGRAPYMLFVYDVRPERVVRIPAVRHVNGTARVQTVNRAQNPRYYEAVRAFGERTGVPVLVNTSFNSRSEPMVCTPKDALECFWTTPLDALAIGSYIVQKSGSTQARS